MAPGSARDCRSEGGTREDKKGGGGMGGKEIKIINSSDELCTCCLG